MSSFIFYAEPASPSVSTRSRTTRTPSPEVLRAWLIVSAFATALAATAVGDATPLIQADPQLAVLLRGMALIKASLVLAAVAVLFWRFGHPLSKRMATAYVCGTAVLAGATMLIWQLTSVASAALAFHVALMIILVAAWRDGGAELKFTYRRRAS